MRERAEGIKPLPTNEATQKTIDETALMNQYSIL
jgi:hypothetical protein